MRRSGLLRASGVWLAVYIVCLLFVTSFIVFEVLDIDGSDWSTHPAKMAARLEESRHGDIKRVWFQQPVKIWTGAAALLEIRQPERPERHARALSSLVQPVREHRTALPRAALADVPPSA